MRHTVENCDQLHIGLAGPFDLCLAEPLLIGPGPSTRGYAASLTVNLAADLLRRGHIVTVFTESTDRRDVGVFTGQNLKVHVVPMRRHLRWLDLFRSERRELLRVMADSGVHLVHAHWTYEFALAALKLNRPVVVTAHDWAPEILRFHRDPYRLARLLMQRSVLRHAKHLTTVSPYLQERLTRLSSSEIKVIPNPVRVSEWRPRSQSHPVGVIGSVLNGFTRLKNAKALLEGFALFRESNKDAELRMVGDGFERGGPAQRWAESRGFADAVTFLGPIRAADVPSFMRSLDVFVSPSREESFGMTLLEAMIEGTPVVAGANSGAVPWVLDFGEAGELVNVLDPASIADGIERSLQLDQSSRRTRREYVRENFSLERVGDLYEATYRSALTDFRLTSRES